ncbi:hypothetical protein NHX12_001863 [Muraenolepis orangiensis]|uniref:Uncharacterized protein n=1 Tax=Muraenolepis orangiensis TaxID=630683 RepID=A0A9Q0E3B9_9TELE|nr:hypothetical protein NHX12_001863 [Muraenolepis orangiensis]
MWKALLMLTQNLLSTLDNDDEDSINKTVTEFNQEENDPDIDKTTAATEASDQFTVIVVGVAVAMVALSVAVIVAIQLARRHMHSRQQG